MKTAAAKYKVAYALVQTPVIALQLGKAEVAIGQLIEGRQTLLGVARLPVKPHETALTTNARTEASALAVQVEPRIASVTLKINRPAGAPAPAVAIDGVAIPELALDTPRRVDPGHHVLVVTGGSTTREVPFDIAERETREVPVPYVGGALPVLVQGSTPAQSSSNDGSSSHTGAYVAFGVGAAGVVATAVFGVLALSDQSTLKGECGAMGTNCPASARSKVSSLSTDSLISDVGLGVAVVGAGVGVIPPIVQHGGDKPRGTTGLHVEPWLGPGAGGLRGSF